MVSIRIGLLLLAGLSGPSVGAQREGNAELRVQRLVSFLELTGRHVAAADSLVKLRRAALPRLMRPLAHPAPVVLRRIIKVLGRFGRVAEPALPALEKLTRSPELAVALAAYEARKRILFAGRTVVADVMGARVLELGARGKELAEVSGLTSLVDVEKLLNGRYLVTQAGKVDTVREVDDRGDVHWAYTKLRNPRDAERLPDGNTLIADESGARVLEVNSKGRVVWTFRAGGLMPVRAHRLPNGNTLPPIAGQLAGRETEAKKFFGTG